MTDPDCLTNEILDQRIEELTRVDSAPQAVAGAVGEKTGPRGRVGSESSESPPYPRGALAGSN
jgi:hypothetical protein